MKCLSRQKLGDPPVKSNGGPTKYHWTCALVLLFSLIIFYHFPSPVPWLAWAVLWSVFGLVVGLGVYFPQWQFFGPALCRVNTPRRVVAMTFDDGPDPAVTPALLEVLADRGVRATFFCIGEQVAQHPELVQRIHAAGHQIENHSFRHSRWTNLFSMVRLKQDLEQAQHLIQQITGRKPVFYRPPVGLTNLRVFRIASELQLEVVGYSARGLDQSRRVPETIVSRIMRRLRPGAILVLHDGGVPVERLLAVVRMLLDKLQTEGYSLAPLGELTVHVGSEES
jgi:peptidoglycan-N-acetylglucosamine deacetylase